MFYQPRFQDTEHELLYLVTLFKGTGDYSGVKIDVLQIQDMIWGKNSNVMLLSEACLHK